jgi:hypothetical protein
MKISSFLLLVYTKKVENVAAAVGHSTSFCRNIFTSREKLTESILRGKRNYELRLS